MYKYNNIIRCNSCPGVGREKDTMTHAIESIFSRGEGGLTEEDVRKNLIKLLNTFRIIKFDFSNIY